MSCNHGNSAWTRRSVLQAGVGLAAGAMTRDAWGQTTAVDAERPCVDMPLLTVSDSEAAAAQKSPTSAALLHNSGKGTVQSTVSALSAINLSKAFAPGTGVPDSGPSRAAFSRRWDINVLNVFFQGGSAALKTNVLRRLEDWSSVIKMDFKHVQRSSDSQIRVNFIRGKGHWSFVGNDSEGQSQTMNLDMTESSIAGAYNQGVILHEFGHSLGMIHEHQNASSTIKFKDASELIPFFRGSGLETADAIRINVTNRYQASQLIKFSEFDPQSIMLYAFPQSMLREGAATKQNTVLSALDVKFARFMYGPRGSDFDGGGVTETTTPERQSFDLKLNADPLEAKLPADGNVEFNLTIERSDGNRDIAIYTTGTTRVMLVLADSAGKDITPKETANHGTPDLMNEAIRIRLAAGNYKVTVTHPSARGGGHFKIRATTEAFKKYLAAPNEWQ